MTDVVIDCSVAIKWVVAEPGSAAALALRATRRFVAPDLFAVETANVLWRKTRQGLLSAAEAEIGCALLARAGVRLQPTQPLMQASLRLALALGHPVYDCCYLALAATLSLPFVTADRRLGQRVADGAPAGLALPEVVLLA